MPNNYFNFKQFSIDQSDCAMKVGTDGVLLGAWANTQNINTILDIGTGTGLIAIMIAQRSNAQIYAIEIDKKASQQATQNIENCKWNKRIAVKNISFQDYIQQTVLKFDLIVTNPPYFSRSMKSAAKQRNLARHDDSLPLKDLFKGVAELLSINGKFCLILPYEEKTNAITLAQNKKLFCNNILNIKPTTDKQPKRILLEFSNQQNKLKENIIAIEHQQRHEYTDEYKLLTKDFYLAF